MITGPFLSLFPFHSIFIPVLLRPQPSSQTDSPGLVLPADLGLLRLHLVELDDDGVDDDDIIDDADDADDVDIVLKAHLELFGLLLVELATLKKQQCTIGLSIALRSHTR